MLTYRIYPLAWYQLKIWLWYPWLHRRRQKMQSENKYKRDDTMQRQPSWLKSKSKLQSPFQSIKDLSMTTQCITVIALYWFILAILIESKEKTKWNSKSHSVYFLFSCIILLLNQIKKLLLFMFEAVKNHFSWKIELRDGVLYLKGVKDGRHQVTRGIMT